MAKSVGSSLSEYSEMGDGLLIRARKDTWLFRTARDTSRQTKINCNFQKKCMTLGEADRLNFSFRLNILVKDNWKVA